ncbi:hypothetical protein HJC23_012555 [Cyclotella cryptica]|uniref:Sulfate transporter n=1 Tax=Cyclotella cryptica TaxID=29204 RepID=A0ABD3QSN7_9STRA
MTNNDNVNDHEISSSRCNEDTGPNGTQANEPINNTTHNDDDEPHQHKRTNPITSRLRSLHQTLTVSELSGSLGDLGTFIPLTTALARQRKISLGPALFWAGLSNVITGWMWDVPMCVQPMKSIAAVALSGSVEEGGMDALSVTTAGILAGGVVLFLGVTNLMEVVNWVVPLTVVCGIQVGVGVRLASKGMKDVMDLTWGGGYDCIGLAVGCAVMCLFWLRENEKKEDSGKNGQGRQEERDDMISQVNDQDVSLNVEMGQCQQHQSENMNSSLHHENVHSLDSTMLSSSSSERTSALHSAIPSEPPFTPKSSSLSSCFHKIWNKTCCCLHLHPSTPHPVGIYLFLIGSIFAAITLATAGPDSAYDLPLHFFGAPIVINALKGVSPSDWSIGFLRGTLPQLPLTALNSVISVCCLAHNLYPEKRNAALEAQDRTDAVVTRREVSISVGLMNLLLCPLGSMPNCHGAGGLAGQHRFGARHGTSVVILGFFKMGLAVFFGSSALTLLDALPVAVLGVMVAIAGLELVGTGVGMLVESVEKEKEKVTGCRARSGIFDPKKVLREKTLVAMVTGSVIIATSRTDYGALAGWVAHMIYGNGILDFVAWTKKKRSGRTSV